MRWLRGKPHAMVCDGYAMVLVSALITCDGRAMGAMILPSHLIFTEGVPSHAYAMALCQDKPSSMGTVGRLARLFNAYRWVGSTRSKM